MAKKSPKEKPRKWRSWRTARRWSQGVFLLVFLWLIGATISRTGAAVDPAAKEQLAYPVELFLNIDPFAGAIVLLSTHSIPGAMILGLIVLISGFVFCEAFGFPHGGWAHRFGTLIAGVIGAFGPYLWSGKAQFYLAVPTSVFGLSLLPFAYITFFLLMNQRSLLADDLPRGLRRWIWNLLMLVAAGIATAASLYVVYTKTNAAFGSGWYGLGGVGALLLLVLIAQFTKGPADE